jgi:hypothetical protein
MSTINVPPAKNYSSSVVAMPCNVLKAPEEGNKMIPMEINWGTMASDEGAVHVNFSGNTTLNFRQIVALSVDNSACGSDIQFVFPDTGETTTFPAYAPKAIIEVFTNQTQFYVVALNSRQEDVTNFTVLNFLPPPGNIPFTVEQSTVAVGNLAADGSTTHTIIDNGIDGTLLGITVDRSSPWPNVGFQTFQIEDGNGVVLFVGQFDNGTANSSGNVVLLTLNPIHVRFLNGLFLTQTGVDVGGSYCVNLLYRTP